MNWSNFLIIRGLRSVFKNRRPPVRTPFTWKPSKFCPRFEWLGQRRIRILQGALAGKEADILSEILPDKAAISIYLQQDEIGRANIERNPPGVGIILWDIVVKEEYRQRGVASIMTYCIFRELLFRQDVAFFKIRMLRVMKPGESDVELQNIGICVIGNRLGFTPEFNLDQLLRPNNIIDLKIIPGSGGYPPGFKIVTKSYPFVLIAFVLHPETLKPVDSFRTYVQLTRDDSIIYNWVRRGLIVIANGNYLLRRQGIDQFVNCIAVDEPEAQFFRRKIQGL